LQTVGLRLEWFASGIETVCTPVVVVGAGPVFAGALVVVLVLNHLLFGRVGLMRGLGAKARLKVDEGGV
jgi:hypothetical protein